ncbi:ABC-F family ATP-binding cassette domain-containing protein [candidate division WWE3 bacterium]|nr:ABC-F family ATP-binding cassette domain-containing protein [candidate division WWE3 bacterium]
MENKKLLIQLNNVSFKYLGSTDYLFNDIKLTVKQGDRTAIVGANGSGKSTLLKLLTGKLAVEEGDQTINCNAYYVQQVDLSVHKDGLKIHEYIAKFYEEWWDVLPVLEKFFGMSVEIESEIKNLSGGELMKLNLAIALKHNPDVLILDEPTNHLDVRSVNTLIEFIKNDTKGKLTYIIVSHDTYFLDQVVDTIWELENQKITSYGGNYSFYKEQKELHLKGIRKQYELAKEKLERAENLEQQEQEKHAKKANEAKRAFIKGSIDKTAYSEGKNAASSLQHSKSSIIEKLKEEAEQKLVDFETEERRLAFINMKNTSENTNRTILEVTDGTLSIGSKKYVEKINLKITYGDRVLISGDNGTGKTSLIKALVKKSTNVPNIKIETSASVDGEVYFGNNLSWVYIDQQYSLIDPNLSLIQNLLKYNTSVTEQKAKEQLGKFQFKTEHEMEKPAGNLSGGEMVRLIMAMITSFAIDLIVLDEPTNNLDVATVEVLVKSLNNFRGAIVLISHNIDFITQINIKSAFIIKNKSLKVINVDLNHKESFFKALTA